MDNAMDRLKVAGGFGPNMQVVFQPGNGTRYELFFSPTGDGDFLVAWVASSRVGRCCAKFGLTETLHWSYAKEKLGRSGEDLCALMLAIHEVMGIEVVLEEGYDDRCCYTFPEKG